MRALVVPLVVPLVIVTALCFASARPQPDGDERFRGAVREFLAALRPQSRELASFPFDDGARLDWHFVPRARKGLPLGAMSDEERRAAHALLRTMLTPRGYGRALGVIELESVLRELEENPGRDPGRYFFSVFGDGAGETPWSMRLEGHHLALNFTGAGIDGVATTPLFLGANPAEVRSGPRAGFKLLAPHEERARALVKSLTAAQRTRAVISTTAPSDVLFGPGTSAAPKPEEGIAITELTREQRELVAALFVEIEGDVAVTMAEGAAARDEARFVWAGGLEPGQGHYWRLSGPGFVFEYDNTQDGANHIHFLWRDPRNDFAAAWLARHHAAEHPRRD